MASHFSPSAIAIVNTSNCPLLVKTSHDDTDKEAATKLIYSLHASLDIVQEKAEQQTSRDNFLGILSQCEQYRIYGLMSTTKVKILMSINQRYNLTPPRENDVRMMLKNIHKAFIDATAMNPFYKPNEPIKSRKLDDYLDSLLKANPVWPAAAAAPTIVGDQIPV